MEARRLSRRDLLAGAAAIATGGLWSPVLTASGLKWAWCGAVTDESVVIKAAATPGRAVSLEIRRGSSVATRASVVADDLGVASFTPAALVAATTYTYVVAAEERSLQGRFRTLARGPFPFRLAFASCASTGSNSSVFDAIRATAPQAFIHMGDLHYENIADNDEARFAKAYDAVLASERQARLYRDTPIVYMWDDHDYGPNDSDRDSPSRTAALAAYRRFVPHYPLASTDGPVQQAFWMGRVRVILLDTRSARAPKDEASPRTMLGRPQLAWLDGELEAARSAALLLLVNSVPWITKADETTREGWAPYAEERRHIANTLERTGLARRTLMLSGDAHQLALDDGTHSQYATLPGAPQRAFPVLHAAPMDRFTTQKGGPYSHGELRQNGQFGVLDVEDSGGALQVRFQAHRKSGPAPNMRMAWTCDDQGLRRSDLR